MKLQGTVQKPPTKCCGILSVRFLTALMCAGLIIFATTTTLVVTFRFSLSAANDIATTHSMTITADAKEGVENFLNRPLSTVIGWQYSFDKHDYPLPNASQWYLEYWNHFVAAMRGSGFKYQFLGIGFEDGNAALCQNSMKKRFQCRVITRNSASLDKNGTEIFRIYTRKIFSDVGSPKLKSTNV